MTTNTQSNGQVMPILFIGHGTPMNAIEDNKFSNSWKELGNTLPHPKAILCISAHWQTEQSAVTAMDQPKTIHDFGGFPRELYLQEYPAPGSPELADSIQQQIKTAQIAEDYQWGLDHGTWCFLQHMYPKADIPVLQLSIDFSKPMQYHYELGKELRTLRRQGVLVAGSGNIIHNLWLARPGENGFNDRFAYDWADRIDALVIEKIHSGDHAALIDYEQLDKNAKLAIPTPEHYIPLIYIIAMQEEEDSVSVFNRKIVAGSLSMTSFVIGNSAQNYI